MNLAPSKFVLSPALHDKRSGWEPQRRVGRPHQRRAIVEETIGRKFIDCRETPRASDGHVNSYPAASK